MFDLREASNSGKNEILIRAWSVLKQSLLKKMTLNIEDMSAYGVTR